VLTRVTVEIETAALVAGGGGGFAFVDCHGDGVDLEDAGEGETA